MMTARFNGRLQRWRDRCLEAVASRYLFSSVVSDTVFGSAISASRQGTLSPRSGCSLPCGSHPCWTTNCEILQYPAAQHNRAYVSVRHWWAAREPRHTLCVLTPAIFSNYNNLLSSTGCYDGMGGYSEVGNGGGTVFPFSCGGLRWSAQYYQV